MKLRLKILNMTFVRYHYFALLTCSIFLYFIICNQFFYQTIDTNHNNSISHAKQKNSCSTETGNSNCNVHSSSDSIVGRTLGNNNNSSSSKNKVRKRDKSKTELSVSKSKKLNTKHNVTVNVSYSKSVVTNIVKVKDNNRNKNNNNKNNKRTNSNINKNNSNKNSFNTSSSSKKKKKNVEKKAMASTSLSTTADKSDNITNNNNVETTTSRDWLQLFKDTASKVYKQLFSPDYLADYRKWAVGRTRESIKEEMKGYIFTYANKTLDDFVIEKGGQPIRNVIFTTWRSGSTFLGEILNSHPATFYHYEPLLHFGLVQVRDGAPAKEALRVVRSLLNCNYNNLTDYMTYGQLQHWLFNHNSRVWSFCAQNHQVCWEGNFHEKMCKMFPFQALKTVRMRLKLARPLLEDKKLNIKLLHLVRDPRGTIQSRFHRVWCPNHPDCEDPAILCSDLVQDYYEAKKLRIEYPDRFMVVRYEDISPNINTATKKIFEFFRLQYHPKVELFIDEHTKENVGGVSSTYRDSKTAPFHWLKDLAQNWSTVVNIQNSCKKALDLWGYNYVQNEKQLLNFKPLKNPPWTDMIIS